MFREVFNPGITFPHSCRYSRDNLHDPVQDPSAQCPSGVVDSNKVKYSGKFTAI